LLISFLSSGSVINIEEIPTNVNATFIDFIGLPYGGYISVYATTNANGPGCIISGDIIDQNNRWY